MMMLGALQAEYPGVFALKMISRKMAKMELLGRSGLLVLSSVPMLMGVEDRPKGQTERGADSA